MNQEEYNAMEFGGCDDGRDGCTIVNYQYANISVPVEVKPETTTGDITVECCDEPMVECCTNECGNGLDIVITQKVCIKIPIRYQIESSVGEERICCE